MSAILGLFDREQRRKRAVERWYAERVERIAGDVKRFMEGIRDATEGGSASMVAWKYVDDHSEFVARVLAVTANNLGDECAIGRAVKTLVEHHLYEAAERKEDNRLIRIDTDGGERDA